MKVFFVRHGQSEYNQQGLYQDGLVELSKTGKLQAQYLAKRFENIPIDLIISSDFIRTVQTAEEIQRTVNAEMIYTHALREIKNPSEIIGMPYFDEKARKIKVLVEKNTDPSWHYSDEENLAELHARARKFVSSIKGFKQEHILIVTHAAILKMIVCVMVFGDLLSIELYQRFDQSWDLNNTSITECYQEQDGVWKVRVWNDDKHLG